MYQVSDIEILIATMNRDDLGFLEVMFSKTDVTKYNILIINQTTTEKQLHTTSRTIKVINVLEKGLSKSRNLALRSATKKLVIFTDDDVVFEANFDTSLLKAFTDHPHFDGFRFPFQMKEGVVAKKYSSTFQSQLSAFDILNTSSVELVFKKEAIQSARLHFDENFGLGSPFYMGEEAIFVFDAKRKGLKMGFVPQILLTHSQFTTTQKATVLERYFYQSAVFYRIFGKMYLFWVVLKLLFDLKQHKIGLRTIPQVLKQALKGKKAYVDTTAL
ncbi:glycosyltransferase family 2 protein [Flavobacterium sp.]|jgi:GT2 family glycosyltransferase|uniref:glycosyltransferase family 2 protein n=1 Tax=Flavobacterium sp. TaxID=239 RepID=UPI0037BEB678